MQFKGAQEIAPTCELLLIRKLDLDPHPPVHFARAKGPSEMPWERGRGEEGGAKENRAYESAAIACRGHLLGTFELH